MVILRAAAADEMVAAFLLAEIDSHRAMGSIVGKMLADNGLPEELIRKSNTKDAAENQSESTCLCSLRLAQDQFSFAYQTSRG